ncbi:RsiV family protein [Kineococcus xinjiangensis]|uniref:RsiV family protein n=1 Tax=Kineococcus xinjiangensis TaxID=512762 RepID=UPI0011B0DB83|nr:RsiV family protein [Kineococcus xinjiangensis]
MDRRRGARSAGWTAALALGAALTGCSAPQAPAGQAPGTAPATPATPTPESPAPESPASSGTPQDGPTGEAPTPVRQRLVADTPLRLTRTEGSLTYDVQVPRFTGSPVAAEVNRRVLASAEHAVQAARRTVRAGDPPRVLDGDGVVTTNDGRTVQVHYVFTDFTEGTAHPTGSVSTVTLDARDGSPITLDQVFADERAALGTLAEEVRRFAAARDQPVDDAGLEPVRENWASWQTTPDGMVVSFQDYQLGGHGLRDYTIAWDVLEPLMTPSSYALLGPLTGA